ncbi:tRNA 2-thiouridine synthesizing protein B [Serratia fonticola]|jgi:tRNA 2-thiouridine synthesizing protein B|uniref:Protein TusB n=1 Tax=Serratia fonticola TaxID=47917 RepID=A0A542CX39_SERFO|nr:sulfurtransferase complex subunit TusB [Serratia fonticola]TQI77653.1 tRNA 2-thiouridine synthesizing protein B [Serratia fonticola]TQI95352.1 tRNA 2-thiouridine synthesizing protein B [Serratia fonticola]TVZ69847.1 tRNA 2-thiouridine synthesizing protein B [Serratia fonticola]
MLYTLSHSPAHCDLPALLRLTAHGDALLLLQDGVVAGLAGSASLDLLINAPISLYALQDDLDARGLSGHISHKVSVIGYTHFVELTEKHRNQMAW